MTGGFWSTRPQNFCHWAVRTLTCLKAHRGTPDVGCHDDREKVLVFDGLRDLFCEPGAWKPVTLDDCSQRHVKETSKSASRLHWGYWRKVQPFQDWKTSCFLARDSSSLHLHQCFCDQSSNKAVILSDLSWGRHACTLRESSLMPRMVRHVDGPSCLSRWRGFQV